MQLPRVLALVSLVFGLLAPAPASPQAPILSQTPAAPPAPSPKRELDVPYVPTHEKVVDEMLKVAKVKKSDVLYDLGSGDGRIVITAARRFGTRGTGVDLDPERIQEAKENAKKAGVEDRVRFIQGDLFDTDLRDATVVTLYLLPAVNMKLRPKLLSELRPGTRVVSHNYDMGDWTPEKTIRLKLPDGEHVVYFWVVPPRAAGSGG
jgi:Methyltransferase domain